MNMKTAKGTDLPLIQLKGKEYLEVKYRLLWFREEHPMWPIETEFVQMDEDAAMAKASIRNEQGQLLATAHKFEDRFGFTDFREKAETGAIGRALAILGYGTASAIELEEGERIVDAPVDAKLPSSASAPRVGKKAAGKSLGVGSSASAVDAAAECCGRKMNVSKFNPNVLYCAICRSKKNRQDELKPVVEIAKSDEPQAKLN